MPFRFSGCGAFGVLLTIAAVVLGILISIGQINGSTVPRHIRMAVLYTEGLQTSLSFGSTPGDVFGNPSNVNEGNVAAGTGLRTNYQWGLWGACEGFDGLGGAVTCNSTSIGREFRPYGTLLHDLPAQYQNTLAQLIGDGNLFANDDYFGRYSKAAFYVIFVGVIISGLAMLIAVVAHHVAFLLASLLSFLAFLCLAVGAIIWTVILARAMNAINGRSVPIGTNQVEVGLRVAYGNGLWMLWGATGAMLLATIPLAVSCLTGRRKKY